MLQKTILENQRLRQEIEMLRGHGVGKREVGLLQLCGGMRSSVSGKVAQSEGGTDATPGIGGGMLSGRGQPVGAPIQYGGGSDHGGLRLSSEVECLAALVVTKQQALR